MENTFLSLPGSYSVQPRPSPRTAHHCSSDFGYFTANPAARWLRVTAKAPRVAGPDELSPQRAAHQRPSKLFQPANAPSHPPGPKRRPNRAGKVSEALEGLFWRCQGRETSRRSGASPRPAAGPRYRCFFPLASVCICCMKEPRCPHTPGDGFLGPRQEQDHPHHPGSPQVPHDLPESAWEHWGPVT